jgi:uncharacterized protein YdeI (YjbR/CyaY-like superfamily)
MAIRKILHVGSRDEWRDWLADNHGEEQEVWLILYKKGSPEPLISYEEAVEEAVCFGWIDSQSRSIDDATYAQRFSPRRPASPWSESNRARVLKMLRAGKMAPAGLASLPGDVLERWNEQG